ncbi:hypothetical protein V6N13_018284 [Hibiscus sabdariffa]|uniref:TF-B3 domain-containing protein n=1 Tax=Hibiscus sabdariffa TaxID=183260 RepID=A0ABR2EP64_9ROSI
MAEIFEVALASNNKSRLRFYHSGGQLHGGSSVLKVRDDCGGSWIFDCKSEGGGYFTISGPGWSAFAKSRINAMVTLFKQADGFYTIRVGY